MSPAGSSTGRSARRSNSSAVIMGASAAPFARADVLRCFVTARAADRDDADRFFMAICQRGSAESHLVYKLYQPHTATQEPTVQLASMRKLATGGTCRRKSPNSPTQPPNVSKSVMGLRANVRVLLERRRIRDGRPFAAPLAPSRVVVLFTAPIAGGRERASARARRRQHSAETRHRL